VWSTGWNGSEGRLSRSTAAKVPGKIGKKEPRSPFDVV
jgi:hypothetical protein